MTVGAGTDVADRGPLDPGLQAERTGLAWTRTALAVAANAALVVRSGLVADRVAVTAAGIGLGVTAAAVAMIGLRRHQRIVQALLDERCPVETRTVLATATATVAAALVVVVLTLLEPG